MRYFIMISLAVLALGIAGCEDETVRYVEIDVIPAVPQGVYSITGDQEVLILWLPVQDSDFDHYRVYWSADDDLYEFMANSDTTYYLDTDVSNGETYFYAVTAVDNAGNESALSYETVFDTPRPEDNDIIFTMNSIPGSAGFDFSAQQVVAWDSPNADIYIDYILELNAMFINVSNDNIDIQDMGYTYDFDEIGYSPLSGWSEIGWVELVRFHTYVIWTADDHYAKVRPTNINGIQGFTFEWAYQTDGGNPELARPRHDDDFLGNTKSGTLMK